MAPGTLTSALGLSPEFEFELDVPGRNDTMGAPGRYRLMRPGGQVDDGAVGPVGFELEADGAGVNLELPPLAAGGLVGVAERSGQRVLVPRTGSAENGQVGGEFGLVTQRTVDGRADVPGAPGGAFDPRSELERWPVTDVLVVVAGQFGYPVAR